MNKTGNLWVIWLLGAAAFLLAACASSQTTEQTTAVAEETTVTTTESNTDSEHGDGEEHDSSLEEHDSQAGGMDMEHEHVEVPDEFAALESPIAYDETTIAAGEQIYSANCAACHGANGAGDGPAAAALDPKPADFTDAAMMNSLSDAYLFWRISQGGTVAPFNSAMPAWENALSEEERWQVIAYIRSFTDHGQVVEGEHDDGEEHASE